MALRLTYRALTSVPVEVEGLTPDWACEKSLAEIERFEVFDGNRKVPLGEMFSVAGDPGDRRFDVEGDLAGVHWLGAHMQSGEVVIHGPAGRHIGSAMTGGVIRVEGDAGGWVGAEMAGGLIHVQGSAGHLVGGAYRGSRKGMTGGTILIDGNAGNEVGHTMRRGLIAIGGAAGDMLAFNMLAGTVFVFGECGIRPGAGMNRGTLCLMHPEPPQLLPTFRYGSKCQPLVVRLLLRDLRERGFSVNQSLDAAEFDLYHGDLVAAGKGEIFLRRAAPGI
jgi:formylmethanofuran dehydrogenase subunit C